MNHIQRRPLRDSSGQKKSKRSLHRRIVAKVLWRHAHLWVDWRGWCRSVWSSGWTRVVLASTPAQTDSRVSDRVALHLVDGHLGSVTLNELDETAALSWRDLDVCYFAKALEERAELVLGHVAGKTTNKDGSVVRVGELVHWLRLASERRHAIWLHVVAAHHLGVAHAHRGWTSLLVLVLGGRSRNPHGAVAAVDALHLGEGALLVRLVREANETIAT